MVYSLSSRFYNCLIDNLFLKNIIILGKNKILFLFYNNFLFNIIMKKKKKEIEKRLEKVTKERKMKKDI